MTDRSRIFGRPEWVVLLCCFYFCSVFQVCAADDTELPTTTFLDRLFEVEEKTFDKSVDETSQQLLTELPETARMRPDQNDTQIKDLEIPTSNQREEILELRRKLTDVIDKYLESYPWKNSPGIDLVKKSPKYLDLRLLKFRRLEDRGTSKVFSVIFDDQFHQHVRTRGMQLSLLKSRRFPKTVYASLGVFAGLLLMYGGLKLVNSRMEHKDHLSTSHISMV